MRLTLISFLAMVAGVTAFAPPRRPAPAALMPNANERTAGSLHSDVLAVDLDAVIASWPTPGTATRGATVLALAERGKAPSLPAPLIRVPAGTLVRVSVRNTLAERITFFLPTASAADDSMTVAPGEVAEIAVRATSPGNFIYRAKTDSRASQVLRASGAMIGAMIVDSVGPTRPVRDRVLVILQTADSSAVADVDRGKSPTAAKGWSTFTINGKSWPNTDRIAGTVGDTLHWRVINASWDVHPMHLHGFYYRVDEFAGLGVTRDNGVQPGTMVVTQRMVPYSAMAMTWVPERSGNWLFHCHFSLHLAPDAAEILDTEPTTRAMPAHDENHALTGMVGLAVGLNIAPRRGSAAIVDSAPARKLRLLAVEDAGYPPMRPSLRFAIEENGRRAEAGPGFSPTLYLRRNERVQITVVNTMREPTGVHWHGMELESYFDGVAGLSGTPARLAPTIAPGDSFVARFTPPRSGTFMYHAHMDDLRQQAAGLVGAMIVNDDPIRNVRDNPDDHQIFLKGKRDGPMGGNDLDVAGRAPTDTIVVHAGKPARFRFMSLDIIHPNATVTLTARPDSSFRNLRDTMLVEWTQVAKDGYEFPVSNRTPRVARQAIAMGETYDFEFTPTRRGQQLRIEIRGAAATAALLARVPVRVE